MEAKFDYLTITLKPEKGRGDSADLFNKALGLLRVSLVLDELLNDLEEKGACRFYNARFTYNDVSLKLPLPSDFNNQGLCLEMSGNGLAYFIEYLRRYGFTLKEWLGQFRSYCLRGWVAKISRLDFAIDDIRYNGDRPCLTMRKVAAAACDGDVCCRGRLWSDNLSDMQDFFSVKDSYKKHGGYGFFGTTIQFGNRKSGTICRFYDKLVEQKQKRRELPENLTSWVRCEFEFKREKAMAVVNAWLDFGDEDFSKYIRGVCMDFIRFVDRTSLNVSRCVVKRWWREFLNGCESITVQHFVKPIRSALARAERSIKQNARTFYTMLQICGVDRVLSFISECVADIASQGKDPIRSDIVANLLDEKLVQYEELDGFKRWDYCSELSAEELRKRMKEHNFTYNSKFVHCFADGGSIPQPVSVQYVPAVASYGL